MSVIQPKFRIGEVVRVFFDGEVEGVKVKVHRDVFVFEITRSWNDVDGFQFTYGLGDSERGSGHGRIWSRCESELHEVEPVIQEILKANEAKVNKPQVAKPRVPVPNDEDDCPF